MEKLRRVRRMYMVGMNALFSPLTNSFPNTTIVSSYQSSSPSPLFLSPSQSHPLPVPHPLFLTTDPFSLSHSLATATHKKWWGRLQVTAVVNLTIATTLSISPFLPFLCHPSLSSHLSLHYSSFPLHSSVAATLSFHLFNPLHPCHPSLLCLFHLF